MNNADTNMNTIETTDFKAADLLVTWRVTAAESGTKYPEDHTRRVYVPSAQAKAWDDCESATHALGTRYGGYSYCQITVTGRKLTQAPTGQWGTRCRIVVGIGGGPDDVTVISGWVF